MNIDRCMINDTSMVRLHNILDFISILIDQHHNRIICNQPALYLQAWITHIDISVNARHSLQCFNIAVKCQRALFPQGQAAHGLHKKKETGP